MNSKLRNQKITGRRTMNDEERTKNIHGFGYENVTEALRPWFSSSFSFFSLILSEICFPRVLNPSLQPPTLFYSHNKGGGYRPARPSELEASSRSNLACPGELVASCWSFLMGLDGPSAKEHPLNWLVHPHFEFLAYFLLKHCKILWITWQWVLSSSTRLARI